MLRSHKSAATVAPLRLATVVSFRRPRTRHAKRVKSTDDYIPLTKARNHSDTHADTCCWGANGRVIDRTGQTCSVAGFHPSLEKVQNVPIVTIATAYVDERGVTWILIFHETLYFGASLDHALINPNQIRLHGIPVGDDPTDPNRKFGIEAKGLFIPWETDGTTIYFESHAPSDDEWQNCKRIIMTSENEWIPTSVNLKGAQFPREDTIRKTAIPDRRSMQQTVARREQSYGTTDELLDSVSEGDCFSGLRDLEDRMMSETRVTRDHNDGVYRYNNQVTSKTRHSEITPSTLSNKWRISLKKAEQVIQTSTQRKVRTGTEPFARRKRVDHLDLQAVYINGTAYADWMVSSIKSVGGDTGSHFLAMLGVIQVYPNENHTQETASQSLDLFCVDIGTPKKLITDRAPEYCGRHSKFRANATKRGISYETDEAGRHVKLSGLDVQMRELKRRVERTMITTNAPRRLWNYCAKLEAELMSRMPFGQATRSGYEIVTGQTPDISEWADFGFFDLVWYHKPDEFDKRSLAYWLGVAHRVGPCMCYWIYTASGKVIAESTIEHVTEDDLRQPGMKKQVDDFSSGVRDRLKDTNFQLKPSEEYSSWTIPMADPAYGDGTKTPTDAEYGDSITDTKEEDEIESSVYDSLIGAQVQLDAPSNDGITNTLATKRLGTVKRRATDADGRPIGKSHTNPLMNSAEYDIELEDGKIERMFANQVAANLYSRLDSQGQLQRVFRDIIDHKKDNRAISISDGETTSRNGIDKKPKRTTVGWHIQVEFNDGSTQWLRLKDVMESNPVDLAEYAIANKIDKEPAFAWWVNRVFRTRDRIAAKARSLPKYWRTETKNGVALPHSVEQALQFDHASDMKDWERAIQKEMGNVQIAWRAVTDVTPEQIRTGKAPQFSDFQEITCHIVFDVKADGTKKARFVANGAMTSTPESLTYSSVVSRDSVRICLLLAGLNKMKVLVADIGNAYLNAQCREKVWFEAGEECGEDRGKVCIVTRALYGLKSSGAAWRDEFSRFIVTVLGFKSTRIDPDVYIRRNTHNGSDYYEYLLVYVDDIMTVSHEPEKVMEIIAKEYRLKDGYNKPNAYLGAEIEEFTVRDGETSTQAWSFKSTRYVKNLVKVVDEMLSTDERTLKSCGNGKTNYGPLPTSYHPELDVSDELGPRHIQRYQTIMGMLRWLIELGRTDIEIEVSLMSQYQASPREGHLEALYSIIRYLGKHPTKRLVLDPTTPRLDESVFQTEANWKEIYGDLEEELPHDMPEPLGKPVTITFFVDSDHASNRVTRRSHTGILMFIQNALVGSICKRQNTVESASFSSELVALRAGRDHNVATRIKLRLFGVPIDGPSNFFGDNDAVVKNTSLPESTLNKRHNAINYHVVRESVAAGSMRVGKINGPDNKADALTKLQSYSTKMGQLDFLYDY